MKYKCPHCGEIVECNCLMCSNPFQARCPKCKKTCYVQEDKVKGGLWESSTNPLDLEEGFPIGSVIYEEIGESIHNPNTDRMELK